MKVLDLFSGIGGFSLGLERAGMTTVAFCEIDPFCRKVLAKHWPDVPIFEDIRTLNAETLADTAIVHSNGGELYGEYTERRVSESGNDSGPIIKSASPTRPELAIDVICGGFPCQPWSAAGLQKGTDDHRDLWPEMHRVIALFKPEWVIGENVRGFVSNPMGLDRCITDLEGLGYSVQSFIIPACAVDAPHRRDRCWVIAHSERGLCGGWTDQQERRSEGRNASRRDSGGDGSGTMADTTRQQQHGSGQTGTRRWRQSANGRSFVPHNGHGRGEGTGAGERGPARPIGGQSQSGLGGMAPRLPRGLDEIRIAWPPEPENTPRVAVGVPDRVNRLRALGNAVVPQIPELIGRAIMHKEV